jgi:hypothetical protein
MNQLSLFPGEFHQIKTKMDLLDRRQKKFGKIVKNCMTELNISVDLLANKYQQELEELKKVKK